MSTCFHGIQRTALSLTRGGLFASAILLASLAVPTLALPTLCAQAPLSKLRQESRELLKWEATQEAGAQKDAAITALCDLYVVLRSDDRYHNSDMLRSDAAKIRRRLLTTAKSREHELERGKVEKPEYLSSKVDAAIAAAISKQTSLAETPVISGQVASGHGGAAAADTGWELVELIQRVVSPDFWDRQGGPGTIRYFAMRRVLVVRATTDVHEQIKDLLTALR